ncbi:MAG: DUF190 domain-containing protein [Nitrosopumilus sp.]|nr:DUF190 domain-containing protein [Nitrosopumilus sp.]MDH3487411.1 DUF190 domain-containing protein [Nitrosopumilus sp.]
MRPIKCWQIIIRMRRNDKTSKKRTFEVVLDFLKKNKISGATVWTGVDGYGKRGDAKLRIEGLLMNNPLLIEIIDKRSKLQPLLPDIKQIVDDEGLVTFSEVNAL